MLSFPEPFHPRPEPFHPRLDGKVLPFILLSLAHSLPRSLAPFLSSSPTSPHSSSRPHSLCFLSVPSALTHSLTHPSLPSTHFPSLSRSLAPALYFFLPPLFLALSPSPFYPSDPFSASSSLFSLSLPLPFTLLIPSLPRSPSRYT